MRLDRCVFALRPRTAVESLDLACRVLAGPARRTYATLAAIVLLPAYAACLGLRYGAGVGWPWVWVVAIALATVAQGTFTVAVGRLAFTDDVTASVVLRTAAKRYPSFVTALVARLVVLAATSLSLFIMTIPALSMLLFVPEASLLEGAGPVAALRRAGLGRSVGAEMWRVVLLAFVQGSIVLSADWLGDGVVDGVLQLGSPFGTLLGDGGSAYALLGLFASAPYVATARFLLYIDERTRLDAWDVQVRMMAVGAGASRPVTEAG